MTGDDSGPRRLDWLAHDRCFRLALGLVLWLCVASVSGSAAPRLSVQPWADDLRPRAVEADTLPRARVTFRVDAQPDSLRPEFPVQWSAALPHVDGLLDDWQFVRWHDLAPARAQVSGPRGGPRDVALRFALVWSLEGLWFAGRFRDDAASQADDPPGAITLALASGADPVLQYWRGPERVFRLTTRGELGASTNIRGRRHVPFDARSLGVEAAVRQRVEGTATQSEIEIFVPWDVLFPALPDSRARMLFNVLVEDTDNGNAKRFSFTTRTERKRNAPAWSRLVFHGGPAAERWLVSLATDELEPDVPCEWMLLPFGALSRPVHIEVRGRCDGSAIGPLQQQVLVGPTRLRLEGLPQSPDLDGARRQVELALGPLGGSAWRTSRVRRAPETQAVLRQRMAAERQPTTAATGFPQVVDVIARLQRLERAIANAGTWNEHVYRDSGILVSRAAYWKSLQPSLVEIAFVQQALAGSRPALPPASSQPAGTVLSPWSEHTTAGLPVANVFLRGYRSILDGSVQPYTLYVPRAATRSANAMPLLVALHSFKADERELFERADLAAEAEARGWVVVCPYGRGDTGFQLAGERDVLEVLEHVARQLRVDTQRVYLMGVSMGATGAWLLALRHPDVFAAAAIVSGFGDMDAQALFQSLGYHPKELLYFETQNPARLVRPGLLTRFRIVHADGDATISAAHARIMHDKLAEHRLPHELALQAGTAHGIELFAPTLRANLDFMARVQRSTAGSVNMQWFGGEGGPIATVFARGPFAVIYGTRPLPKATPAVGGVGREHLPLTGPSADRRTAEQFCQEWRTIFNGEPHLLADTEVTPALQRTHNLVVVGDPRSNTLLAEWAPHLPVEYEGDTFVVRTQRHQFARFGVMYAVPHPSASGRTVVVLSAMGERMGGLEKSLLKLGADYIVTDDTHETSDVGDF